MATHIRTSKCRILSFSVVLSDYSGGSGSNMAKMSTVTNFVAAVFGYDWVNLALNQRFEAFATSFPLTKLNMCGLTNL